MPEEEQEAGCLATGNWQLAGTFINFGRARSQFHAGFKCKWDLHLVQTFRKPQICWARQDETWSRSPNEIGQNALNANWIRSRRCQETKEKKEEKSGSSVAQGYPRGYRTRTSHDWRAEAEASRGWSRSRSRRPRFVFISK